MAYKIENEEHLDVKRLETLIAASGKQTLTPNEVCTLYGISIEELAKAVQKMEMRARRGYDGKIYFRRSDVDSYLVLGREIETNELQTVAESIRATTEKNEK